jgi:transposase
MRQRPHGGRILDPQRVIPEFVGCHTQKRTLALTAMSKRTFASGSRFRSPSQEQPAKRLARAISDQGFGEARRMLGYKTGWNGGNLVVADRWFPSSKTCSACGTVKAKLSLSERTFTCEACGLVTGRDVNAARNLLHLAASGAERRNACGGTVRPRPARHVPVKQEPGTPPGGKTGTASGQPLAAT